MSNLEHFIDFLDKAGISFDLNIKTDHKEILITAHHAKVEAFMEFNAKFIFSEEGEFIKLQAVPPL